MSRALTTKHLRVEIVAVALGVVAAALAGCSANASTASTASGSSAQGGSGSACVAEAQSRYKAATQVPIDGLGPVPTVKVDASKAKGKRVAILVGSMASPPNKENVEQVKAALALAGVDATLFDTKAQVSLQSQLFQQAIGQKYDAIYTFGLNMNDMTAQTKAAKAAGIPVIATSGYPNDPKTYPPIPELYSNVMSNDIGAAKLQTDYALWQTNCKGPYAVMSTDFGIFNVQSQAAMDEVAAVCPSCQVKKYQIDHVTDIVGNSRAAGVGALSAQPGLTTILSGDVFATYMIKPVHQAPAGKNVRFYTIEALPDVLPLVKTGEVSGDVQHYADSAQDAWYAADEIMRALTGGKASDGIQVMPMTMVTPANVSKMPSFDEASTQLESKYKVLWGLS